MLFRSHERLSSIGLRGGQARGEEGFEGWRERCWSCEGTGEDGEGQGVDEWCCATEGAEEEREEGGFEWCWRGEESL